MRPEDTEMEGDEDVDQAVPGGRVHQGRRYAHGIRLRPARAEDTSKIHSPKSFRTPRTVSWCSAGVFASQRRR